MFPPIFADLYYLLVVATVEGLARVPSRPLRDALVEGLTRLAYLVSRDKRGRIESALGHAFGPNLERARRKQIVLGSFREFWVEMLNWVPASNDALPLDRIEVRGVGNLQDALRRGKGAILWESNGFGRRVLAKRALRALGYDIHQMFGATHMGVIGVDESEGTWLRHGLLRPLFERRARSFATETILIPLESSMTHSRVYLDLLSENAILCVAGEGRIARKLYSVKFLGQPTPFAIGMPRLARLSGAPLLPIFWMPGESPPAVEILPAIDACGGSSRKESILGSVRQFAATLEDRIRRHPESYRNWHMVGGFEELQPFGGWHGRASATLVRHQ